MEEEEEECQQPQCTLCNMYLLPLPKEPPNDWSQIEDWFFCPQCGRRFNLPAIENKEAA